MRNKIKKLQSGGSGAALGANAGSANMSTFLRNQSGFDSGLLLGQAGDVAKSFSKTPQNSRSDATRGLLTAGLDSVAPGAGTALNLTGQLYQGFTRDDKGRYKSKFAGIVENTNPINLISNIASGDPFQKKLKKKIEQQEASDRFRKNLLQQQSALAAQTQLIGQRAGQGFAPIFKQGGVMVDRSADRRKAVGLTIGEKKLGKIDQEFLKNIKSRTFVHYDGKMPVPLGEKGMKAAYSKMSELGKKMAKQYMKDGGKVTSCGCSVQGDGIDTDVFKSFSRDMMKDVQKFVGSVADGKYKDSDKRVMKMRAAKNGMKLRDFLNQDPKIKNYISFVEAHK